MERITRNPFRGAWVATATVTLVVTILAGILMQLTDPDSFPSVWSGLWWAIQTTTTVGYGDLVPGSAAGRLIATLVMLGGIGFISVTTAGITTAFVESARRHQGGGGDRRSRRPRRLASFGARWRPSRPRCAPGGVPTARAVRPEYRGPATALPRPDSPGPVDAAVGVPERADVARTLVDGRVGAGRHGEHPAQLVDGCESLPCHPLR